MITGDIKHLEDYKKQLPTFIYECLKEVAAFDFTAVPDGKYKINGCDMGVESPVTEPAADRKLEGHKKMIDIQYEVEGEEEWLGVETIFEAGECIESYSERDLYFYKSSPKGESKVYFETGRFAVFFPEDLHRPLCQGESGSRQLRKAVVKVPVEWVSVK